MAGSTLREVEVDEDELDEYCPSCASRLYELNEGKVCGRCSVVYKLRKAEKVYEAWRLHIPKTELEKSPLLLVVLENFPYFVPARFSVEVEGHSCSIYRIDESGREWTRTR
ncbi:MAG: hypothetical protein NXY59_03180 [Aigarchaeota archaeon]|nr:hypothetical protein [Candidatus Pelearchaeum maunauluense]